MLMITTALSAPVSEDLIQNAASLPGITLLDSATSPQAANQVQQFLAADATNRVLVLVEFAADALANALHQGSEALSQQAQQWQHNTEALLSMHKLDRKRIRLVSLQSAQYDPHALQTDFAIAINLPPANPDHSLNSILASQWLTSQPDLTALDQRLRASSKCYNEAALTAHTAITAAESTAHQRHLLAERQVQLEDNEQQLNAVQQKLATANKELSQSQQANSELKQENEMLLNQLHQVQEDLERKCIETGELQKQQESLKQQQEKERSSLNESLKQEKAKSKDLAEENDLILNQLHLVQEELERYYQDLRHSKQLGEKHARKLEELNDDMVVQARKFNRDKVKLQQVQGSIIWKLTKILRVFARLNPMSKISEQAQLLRASDLFDQHWYLLHYPDVAKAGKDAAKHYLRHGANEGRNPGPNFDTEWYLRQYPDVKQSKINPLVHYILFGIEENRKVSPRLLTHRA